MTTTSRPKRARILVVEKNRQDTARIQRAFSQSDMPADITHSPSAEDALKRLSSKPAAFDLAIIDQELPAKKGLQLCRELEAVGIRLPLIFMTAAGCESLAIDAIDNGAYEYVVKDETRSCTTCHTADPRQGGKHIRTGKAIKPLSPTANPNSLTDAKKIEKWFRRNCNWTMGRECSAREKADILAFLKSN